MALMLTTENLEEKICLPSDWLKSKIEAEAICKLRFCTFTPFFLAELFSLLSFPTFIMNFFRSEKPKTSEPDANEKQPVHDPILTVQKDFKSPVPPTLDETQQQKLSQLRDFVADMTLQDTDDYYENEKRFLTDATLHRYMRARKWDVEVMEEREK